MPIRDVVSPGVERANWMAFLRVAFHAQNTGGGFGQPVSQACLGESSAADYGDPQPGGSGKHRHFLFAWALVRQAVGLGHGQAERELREAEVMALAACLPREFRYFVQINVLTRTIRYAQSVPGGNPVVAQLSDPDLAFQHDKSVFQV